MDQPEEWQRIEKIFHEAVELTADKRAGFLDEVCGRNTDLRREVEALLERDELTGVMAQPAMQAATPMVSRIHSWRLTSGTRIGPYQIIESIGAGGMAEVYRAHDSKLRRDVAIKVLPEEFS